MAEGKTRAQDDPRDAIADPTRTEGLDPGAFVGSEPERQATTIPGGVSPRDERISAVASRVGDPPDPDPEESEPPAGHREAIPASDEVVREAGQNR
jgi:hypothetical protein